MPFLRRFARAIRPSWGTRGGFRARTANNFRAYRAVRRISRGYLPRTVRRTTSRSYRRR